jgi:hypothetical protein
LQALQGCDVPEINTQGNRAHRYYRCSTRDKYGRESCSASPLGAAAIESYVVLCEYWIERDSQWHAQVNITPRPRTVAWPSVERPDLVEQPALSYVQSLFEFSFVGERVSGQESPSRSSQLLRSNL